METHLIGAAGRALVPKDWLTQEPISQQEGTTDDRQDEVITNLHRSAYRILQSGAPAQLIQQIELPKRNCTPMELAADTLRMARLLLSNEATLRGNQYFESLLTSACSGAAS